MGTGPSVWGEYWNGELSQPCPKPSAGWSTQGTRGSKMTSCRHLWATLYILKCELIANISKPENFTEVRMSGFPCPLSGNTTSSAPQGSKPPWADTTRLPPGLLVSATCLVHRHLKSQCIKYCPGGDEWEAWASKSWRGQNVGNPGSENKNFHGLHYFPSMNHGEMVAKVDRIWSRHLNSKPWGEIGLWTVTKMMTGIWVSPASPGSQVWDKNPLVEFTLTTKSIEICHQFSFFRDQGVCKERPCLNFQVASLPSMPWPRILVRGKPLRVQLWPLWPGVRLEQVMVTWGWVCGGSIFKECLACIRVARVRGLLISYAVLYQHNF